jgi:Cof subfamily protein (haloacid dehalogenase superfamily)
MADRTDIDDGIALLVADVDGTLLTPDKALTRKARAAVRRLSAAGIAFTLVSSRPPRGLADLVSALALKIPFAAFNGGALCHPDMRLIEAHSLPETVAHAVLELFAQRGVDAWVFAEGDWRLRNPEGPFVADHRRTMGFDPVTVADFTDVMARIDKIVGVSEYPSRLAALEAEARSLFSGRVTINLSQTSYLDVTDVQANKGRAVQALCTILGLDPRRVAVIGDMMNDVAMFQVAGLAVAMGQAPETVKAAADVVTTSNRDEGFADAVGQIVLPRRAALPAAS